MAHQNPHQSFNRILTLVFGVAFGIVGLTMMYKAVQDNTERRSQAAEEQITYKQWEFNGKDAEGWKVPVGTTVNGGYLRLPITIIPQLGLKIGLKTTNPSDVQPSYTLTIANYGVNTVLPVGNKQIKFMIAVGPPMATVNNSQVSLSTVEEAQGGTTVSRKNAGSGSNVPVEISRDSTAELSSPPPSPPQRGGPQYTIAISYTTSDNPQKYIQIPSEIGVANGQSREIAIAIPNSINEMKMSALNIQFTNVPSGSEVRIDWIRLVSPKGRVIPPCKGNAISSVTIENRCVGLKAKSATYQCADGFTGSVGNGRTCEWGNTLRQQVQTICAQHRLCPITPTPQCTPLPRCATEGEIGVNGQRVYCQLDPLPGMTYCPRSTPTPTPTGCYYQQVQCVKAPCDPILVCPSTTIVPLPTTIQLCQTRPSCLDSRPACEIPEPAQGWCVQ